MLAAGIRRGVGQAREPDQQPVEPLHIVSRIGDLSAFRERGLIIQKLCQLLELIGIADTVEILHDRVAGVDLERRLRLRHLLARGSHNAPHARAHIMLFEHENGRRFTQAYARAHFFQSIAQGVSYIKDVASSKLEPLVRAGRLSSSSDPVVLADADAIIICVPTPLNKTKDPDNSFIMDAAEMIVARMTRPQGEEARRSSAT